MILLNPKEASNGDLVIDRRNQQMRFCNTVVLGMSDVAREFTIDKN